MGRMLPFLFVFLFCMSVTLAITPHTVTFTGNLESDFVSDELVYSDSSTDSAWGSFDELYKLYLTWDSSTLYLGVDGKRVENETIDIWLAGRGSSNVVNLQTVTLNKRFTTTSWHPELAVHDDNTLVTLAGIHADSDFTWLDSSSGTLTSYSNKSGILEVAIPWGYLGLAADCKLRCAITISGPLWGGCDAIPAQNPEPNGDGEADELSNWLQIQVADSNGIPLVGISPSSLQSVPVELSSFRAE